MSPSFRLISAVLVVLLGSAAEQTYIGALTNLPHKFIKDWINSTSTIRYGHTLTSVGVNVIWGAVVTSQEVGQVIGAAFAGYLCDRFGRSKVIGTNSFPLLMGLVFQGASVWLGSFELFFMGRFLCSIALGVSSVAVFLFLNEIAPVRLRGSVGYCYFVASMAGGAVAFAIEIPRLLGTRTLWSVAFYIPVIFVVFQGLTMHCYFPDSARYLLVHKNQQLAAEQSITFYEGNGSVCAVIRDLREEISVFGTDLVTKKNSTYGVEPDLVCDKQCSSDNIQLIESNNPVQPNLGSGKLKIMFTERTFRLPLLLTIALCFCKTLSGDAVIMFYSSELLTAWGVSLLTAKYISSALGWYLLIPGLVCIYMVEKVGRRVLLITSVWTSTVMLSIMCIAAIKYREQCDSTNGSWSCVFVGPTILAICLYVSAGGYTIGLGPCGFSLTPEIWPQKYRATATALATSLIYGINIVLIFLTPNLLPILKSYILLILIVPLVIFAVFMTKYCPETKGKTSLEIVEEMNN